jgi:hypothetical protein
MKGGLCPSSLAGRNDQQIVILPVEYKDPKEKGVAAYAWLQPNGQLYSKIEFPNLPPDEVGTDFEVSGTGTFYYLSNGKLFSSTDRGENWLTLN